MKKMLIALFCIFIFQLPSKAQTPTFDETVKYINDIFKENKVAYYIGDNSSGFYIRGIDAKKDGKIILYNRYKGEIEQVSLTEIATSFNLFDIESWSIGSSSTYLFEKERKTIGKFDQISEGTGKRLHKAFIHLQSLSSKNLDPFAN